ncbi:BF3164 family lipoprotein [Capnocytophaga canis]|uniref:BF3164 family lipoprotein n=1 Tax=Capnocytophaga canis TaxID=1848903 RepID=UPI0037D6593F
MTKTILPMLLFAIGLFSCEDKKQDQTNGIRILKIQDSEKQEVIEKITYLPIQEDEQFLFSELSKVIIKNDCIYILDLHQSNSLLYFSKSGNFIRKIGNQGQASDEYIRLQDFDVDDSHVYLYDRRQKKMLTYDLEGNFIESKKTPFVGKNFKVLPNQQFLFALAKGDGKEPLLVQTSADFADQKNILNFQKEYVDDNGTPTVFQPSQEHILFNRAVNDSVFVLNKTGAIASTYVFDFGTKKVPNDLKNSYETLVEVRKENDFAYLIGAPLLIHNRYLVSEIFYEGSKATLLYDLNEYKCEITQWLPEKMHLTDIILPTAAFDNGVVGWMDIDVYDVLKEKPTLSGDLMKHLEEGGKILTFYHFKK